MARLVSNPALEQPILDDPYDPDAYLVYADWLQAQGDPRGELIALEIAAEKDRSLTAVANELFELHAEELVGLLDEHRDAFTWRFGYIHRLKLTSNREKVYERVREHPSGRFLAELAVRPGGFHDKDVEAFLARFAADAPPSLRKLQLGVDRDREHESNWFHSGAPIGHLWPSLRRLRHLVVDGGQFALGELDLPALEVAAFRTGGLVAANARSIARASLPKLRYLDIAGDHNNSTETLFVREGRVTVSRSDGTFSDLAPLLARTDLPKLTKLGVTNCLFTDDVCRALPVSQLLHQLEVLDLSWGCMTDEGARALADNAGAFRKLELLDVSRNYISPRGVDGLRKIAKIVRATNQRPDERRP